MNEFMIPNLRLALRNSADIVVFEKKLEKENEISKSEFHSQLELDDIQKYSKQQEIYRRLSPKLTLFHSHGSMKTVLQGFQ